MVLREGVKKGIRTGNTVKKSNHVYYGTRTDTGSVTVIDEEGKERRSGLNRNKNWEIIENAPKQKPTISKEERKEKNRLEKKHEFEEHLKTRGHHKESPKREEKKKKESKDDSVEVREVMVNEETKVYVVEDDSSRYVKRRGDRPKQEINNNSIVVELPPQEKDLYMHKPHHFRRGSFDYWDTTPFRDVLKKDTGVDFKADGFLKKV